MVWAFREGDGWRSPTAKFLREEELRAVNEALGAEEGDLLLLVADEASVANAVLGQLRLDFYKNSVDRVLTRDPYAAMLPVSFNARLVPNRAYKDGEDFLGEFYRAEHIIVNHTLVAA